MVAVELKLCEVLLSSMGLQTEAYTQLSSYCFPKFQFTGRPAAPAGKAGPTASYP